MRFISWVSWLLWVKVKVFGVVIIILFEVILSRFFFVRVLFIVKVFGESICLLIVWKLWMFLSFDIFFDVCDCRVLDGIIIRVLGKVFVIIREKIVLVFLVFVGIIMVVGWFGVDVRWYRVVKSVVCWGFLNFWLLFRLDGLMIFSWLLI